MRKVKKIWLSFLDTKVMRHLSFLWHWKNFFFLLKYPFYRTYNRWNGEFCGYAFTEYDEIAEGWQKAFGKELSNDIKAAGKASRKRLHKHSPWKKLITWEQIKEKWGELCLYASATEEIMKVLEKYEKLSLCYCIGCGKPARYKTKGWILYVCEDCFIENLTLGRNLPKEQIEQEKVKCRLTAKDVPVYEKYSKKTDKFIPVNMKKEYGIDYAKAWDLKTKTRKTSKK